MARSSLDTQAYVAWAEEHVKAHVRGKHFDEAAWASFLQRLAYVCLDLAREADFARLRDVLDSVGSQADTRVFYLATGPSLFVPVCRGLASAGLNTHARIVLEKPLGHDLASSREINDAVGSFFSEDRIYRIDHYLGKEPVQNLMALRFGNALFEPLWRREWVDNVQITIAEELGVETRGEFYDQTGALRDMVQNHLLQLLAIVAMEPPHSMNADTVRDEKLRVLRSLKPVGHSGIDHMAVRGQYHAGEIQGISVPSYADERGVVPHSRTETYVALTVAIDNPRWAGVPFFLRTGKRLAERMAEIIVNFKPVPHSLLGAGALRAGANRLVIRLQPNESIRLYCLAKQPGEGMNLQRVHLDLALDEVFSGERPDDYERLLLDVINGRLALFVRRDEQEQAWRWIEPILSEWQSPGAAPKPYAAGAWGPAAASAMLAQHGARWREEEH